MAWVVTLQINNCANPSQYLSYASINDGYSIFSADVNGQFIAIVDDFYTAYIVNISKAGFNSRRYTLSKGQNGSIQNVCLNPASTTPPPDGGGSGGW